MSSMSDLSLSIQKSLLFLSDEESFGENVKVKRVLTEGGLLKVINDSTTFEIFEGAHVDIENGNIEERLRKSATLWLETDNTLENQLELLTVGVASLLAFVQDNWTGPNIEENVAWLDTFKSEVTSKNELQSVLVAQLALDGESVSNVLRHPEFLVIARAILLTPMPAVESALWWRFRCLLVHQQILEEKSPQIHDQLIVLKDLLQSEGFGADVDLSVLKHLEIARMHLLYHEVLPSDKALKSALDGAGLSINLTGALGKRTRFQQRDLPQLTLNVQIGTQQKPVPTVCYQLLPKDMKLNDDVRLDKVSFTNTADGEHVDLTPLQQACVLTAFVQTQKCQPKDKLADEELMAYLTCLLAHPKVWSFQLSCLLFRSIIEANNSRTVERSMAQTQVLVDSVAAKDPTPWKRFNMIFCSHMNPRWHLEVELANLLVSLGCVNSALDIYLHLNCWEEVIACYNHLKLRHKAEEIIRQELQKKETVKLWCLLGDATDNVECYEKAWILSNRKSARAQRHWGQYFFSRKQYGEAIPHLQESLSHNSLQTKVWFQLGYAALQHEDWATAANAYRRCSFLDPENFEAWNNLAKAYVKLGQKNRAWKALQEALKWDYENWRVWENFLLVSLDCAVMDEVIRAYHRILDLKEKHVDVEVLEILGKAILENLPDCDGVPCNVHLDKALALLGRITAQVNNNWKVWQLYSRLTSAVSTPTTDTEFRAVQHLQKAHRCAVVNSSWINDNDTCIQILELTEELASVSISFAQKISNEKQSASVLSSAKLSVKSVLTKIKQQRFSLLTGQVEVELLPHYQEVEALLDKIINVSL